MKVLKSLNQLIGKTIKAIELDDSFSTIGYIITEDDEFIAFKVDIYDEMFTYPCPNEILREAQRAPVLRHTLYRHGILSEEEYIKIETEEKRKYAEVMAKRREEEYKQYLRLKEKFER